MRGRCHSSTALALCALLGGCSPEAPGPTSTGTLRLVSRFTNDAVDGAAPALAMPTRTEWRFDATSDRTQSWQAGPDVVGLAVRDGHLSGRASGSYPILDLLGPPGGDDPDQVHAIEVRLRVSAGSELSLQVQTAAEVNLVNLHALAHRAAGWMSAPLRPGPDLQTYQFVPPVPVQGANVRHLLLRPTDAAGASFAIESVRLVFRREHLASIPSGVGWQGLRDVFRETLVARTPERLRFELDLPESAWLDLAVGTVEERPITFRVRVERAGARSSAAGRGREWQRTVTTAYRWEPLVLDLSALAGDRVALTLELTGESPGLVGFWGSPVLRSRSALPAGRPRGVILIQADTLRRDHLDAYGHRRPTAPLLASLASGGVLFRNAVSQASWTKVSTPSILTSLYPTSHGVREFDDRLPASATTVAESFRDAGYATLSLLSVPFTGQYTNLHQGFEELHEASSLANRGGPLASKTAREHVDRLLAWLERHGESPFFVFLHLFDPHSPYEPYAPYDRLWVDPEVRTEHVRQRDEATRLITDEFMKARQMPSRIETEKAGFDPDEYIGVETAWYDASIRAMDVELARLVERLRVGGLEQETLIVLLSDHGTEFYEHGAMFHGHSLYGELTDVPLIVSWPGRIASGRTIEEIVQTIDVVPTLLELAGLAPPAGIQGQSLAPFLQPAAQPGATGAWPGWRRRPAISEHVPSTSNAPPPRNRACQALMDGQWKLIENRTPGLPTHELYDWRRDPLNRTDLAAAHPDVVLRMAASLDAWRRRAEAEKLAPDSAAEGRLSTEELQQLRSLGYLR